MPGLATARCGKGGELAAAVKLRRRFPGINYMTSARECIRIIASWRPLPDLLDRAGT
jgi:hypothetical protein